VQTTLSQVAGIINGTGNFILTDMKEKGRDFNDVLKEAQALGYAEEDPTFDIEGIDAAHKLSILAAIAFGTEIQFDKIYTKGISNISTEDILMPQSSAIRLSILELQKELKMGLNYAFTLLSFPTINSSLRLME
jgi:homoserine dehydrogenase